MAFDNELSFDDGQSNRPIINKKSAVLEDSDNTPKQNKNRSNKKLLKQYSSDSQYSEVELTPTDKSTSSKTKWNIQNDYKALQRNLQYNT